MALNYEIPYLPERPSKPRQSGITMAMDKGLSLQETRNFIEVSAPYVDLVKLGWSTSYVTPFLSEKLTLYREAGLHVYFGGTLLEVFLVRNRLEDFYRLLDQYKMTHIEVSSGSLDLEEDFKLELISKLAKNYVVLSEVGSKDAKKEMAPIRWVNYIQSELQAGSWKVITEAREGGNVGVFRSDGQIRDGLIDEILLNIDSEKILFEAPKKEQQVWFIQMLGSNVNLGNVATNEVIGLETLRLGLRGDTFHSFVHNDLK